MSASFIEYRGQGFWCRDGVLEVWLAMLVEELDASAEAAPLLALRDCLYQHATIRFSGEKRAALDGALDDGERTARTLALSKALRERVASGQWEPDGASLPGRIGGSLWQDDGWPRRVLRVADAFVWLLEGAGATRSSA